ncbi:hypothetical protein QFC19_007845 [Naganishia cerealis]|uniref:Uncharacterized protein n=1 Tax=Naganishia cerealis TaxID=610337 RepID=A0ACC2V6L3_9TREE|nr:hypothetical protein QFC19_007845 [Naganishia cerealis]
MASFNAANIVVVGAGLIGRRHIQHVRDEPQTNLVAVVEPTPAGEELALSVGVPCYASVDDLLEAHQRGEVDIDGAIVGTPTHTHVQLAIQFIQAGVHVLVEKPVAPTAKEGEVLMEALKASAGKIKVLVGQHRRFNPFVIALKAALDSGKLGTILGVQGTWAVRKGPSEYYKGWHGVRSQGGGTISINMIHDMDLLRHLMGDIDSVFCLEGNRTRGLEVEETGGVVMKFKSGAVGTFFFSEWVKD